VLDFEVNPSFTLTVSASDGTLSDSAAITINLTNVNEPPAGADSTISINEDASRSFAVADFGFTDIDAGDAMSAVRIDSFTLPVGATLQLSGVSVTSGDVILTAQLGNLVFTPAPNASGAGYASFTFSVRDSGGPAFDAAPNTLTIDVTPVNDAPALGNNTFTINDGATLALAGGNLSASDIDSAAAGLVFSVGSITNGYFQRLSTPGVPITSFTQAEIAAGQIQFVHDGSGAAPAFTISVTDGAAGVGPYAANIIFNGGGGLPPPPPPPGGGGGGGGGVPPTVTPPAPTPAPTPAPGSGGGGQGFLRGGTSSSAAGGEAAAPSTAAENAPSVATVLAQTFIAESQLTSLRFQSGTVETQAVRTEIEVEPVRAELQVLPTSRQEFAQDDEERARIEVIIGSVRITGLALSVGAVWWAARAAGIIASLLASAPAWRHLDPLPVLGHDEEDEEAKSDDAEEEDDEGAKEEHRARWVLEGR